MDYQYSYLLMDMVMFAIWLFLFIWRKDVRKEMLIISLIVSLAGFAEPIYYRDWWRPVTITNTIPGVESVLWAFCWGGIVGVIYEELFKKKIRAKKLSKIEYEIQTIKLMELLGLCFLILLAGVFLFNLNTLQSTILSFIIGTAIIWAQRNDLIKESIITALLSLLIMIPVFFITEQISPGMVQRFWLFQNVPRITMLYVPLDDIIFYLFGGAFFGPLYEYWQEARFVKLNKQKSKARTKA